MPLGPSEFVTWDVLASIEPNPAQIPGANLPGAPSSGATGPGSGAKGKGAVKTETGGKDKASGWINEELYQMMDEHMATAERNKTYVQIKSFSLNSD